MLTWPTRAHRHGRALYALAITVATVCVLWAGSLYAHGLADPGRPAGGAQASRARAVAVYSAQRLALSGPGVTVQNLGTAFRYPYEYEGLRLLLARSGTYYLLPAGWTPQFDLTYVLDRERPDPDRALFRRTDHRLIWQLWLAPPAGPRRRTRPYSDRPPTDGASRDR